MSRRFSIPRIPFCLLAAILLTWPRLGGAQVCTTQSRMSAADRSALSSVASALARSVQRGDVTGLQAGTATDLAKDFNAISSVVNTTAPKVHGATLTVDQLYLLDASSSRMNPDGSAPDAQFFCSLNQSTSEADFSIPDLPPGHYGFAMVRATGVASPWLLSFLLRQDQGRWVMAGFYPKAASAAGHDGVWYWTQARILAARKQRWNAWLYYREAESLLQPANFVASTHLEKLIAERDSAAPPAVAAGVTAEAPLVVRGAGGAEYHFTALGSDDSMANKMIDVAAHLKVDAIGDPIAARKRNSEAMSALVTAYPELRSQFHGVWVFAEAKGQNPFATEQAMTDIH